jgi:hypothetical protein
MQKYWSVVIYDEYGLPLPHYVYDDIAHRPITLIDTISTSSTTSSLYEYEIRLTANRPASYSSTANVIDISSCRKGYVLFRIVHPRDETVLNLSSPCVELIHITTSSKDKSL